MTASASSRLWVAGAGAAAAVCSYCAIQTVVADCDPLHPHVNLPALSAWLIRGGVDMKGVKFLHTEDMGVGAFATGEIQHRRGTNLLTRAASRLRLWGSHTLAKFPAHSIINTNTICDMDQDFGPVIKEFLSKDMLDESKALQLFLVLHRSLQQQSPYHPYIQGLPTGAELPVNYDEGLLQEIAGTDAYDAVHGLRQAISSSWEEVQPVLAACREVYKLSQPVTQEDWRWACSMIHTEGLHISIQNSQKLIDTRCWNSVSALHTGLDLVNHSNFPSAGEELCIRYQEHASNTSLLLRYGFVEGHNRDDCVRVFIPWDETSPASKRSKQLDLLTRMGCAAQVSGAHVSFWLAIGGENSVNPIPDPAQKLLHVMNMSEKELDECLMNPSRSQWPKPLSLGEELGIATKFLWLLDQKEIILEGAPHSGHTLEDDISVLEQGQDSVHPSLWSCIIYRAGQKRIVRGYRKAARTKLDTIIAAMNEQRSV